MPDIIFPLPILWMLAGFGLAVAIGLALWLLSFVADWLGDWLIDWRAAGRRVGEPDSFAWQKVDEARKERDEWEAAARKFKTYVHARLDAAGVPTDPDSPHKAEGCRIGGRLDVVCEIIAAAQAMVDKADARLHVSGNASWSTDGINFCRLLKALALVNYEKAAACGADQPATEKVGGA